MLIAADSGFSQATLGKILPVLSGAGKEGNLNPRKLTLAKSFLFCFSSFYSYWNMPRQRHIS